MATSIERWLELGGVGKIKSSGEQLIGTCPFHQDVKRSFSMNPETGQYICYAGSCGEYGGLLSFLMKAVGYSYERAKKAAEEFGAYADRPKNEDDWSELPEYRDRHRDQGKTQDEIWEALLGLYDFCPDYLLARGFRKDVLRSWEVGYDFETRRVTIPVRDGGGRLVGFSKRATVEGQETKYLHLNFKKSEMLYGAPGEGGPKVVDSLWVGEGQLDAIALCQMGATAVSTMGARVSKKQIKLLSVYDHVVLAYDSDVDGWAATERIGDALIAKGRKVDVAYNYPAGAKDPADLLKRTEKVQRRFMEKLLPYEIAVLESRCG